MDRPETSDRKISGAILIVDDDAEARQFLSEFLKCIGFSDVATAKDGQEALRKLEKLPTRLVLLDYRLPDIDGLAVLEKIKKTQPHLPVIMMTAYPNEYAIEGIVEKGAFDLVVKPLNLQYLEQAVVTGFAS